MCPDFHEYVFAYRWAKGSKTIIMLPRFKIFMNNFIPLNLRWLLAMNKSLLLFTILQSHLHDHPVRTSLLIMLPILSCQQNCLQQPRIFPYSTGILIIIPDQSHQRPFYAFYLRRARVADLPVPGREVKNHVLVKFLYIFSPES